MVAIGQNCHEKTLYSLELGNCGKRYYNIQAWNSISVHCKNQTWLSLAASVTTTTCDDKEIKTATCVHKKK